jgi:hypothetical protein
MAIGSRIPRDDHVGAAAFTTVLEHQEIRAHLTGKQEACLADSLPQPPKNRTIRDQGGEDVQTEGKQQSLPGERGVCTGFAPPPAAVGVN